jgi:CubicO group peptidase (beta-lactamase class C family)
MPLRSPALSVFLLLITVLPLPGEPPELVPAVEAASQLPRMRSLLVSRRGEIILEHYFNGARANRTTNIKSAAKSFISALIGIAIDRQLIDGVDAPIGPFFPEYLAGEANAAKRAITVEDLLTMRSGLRSTSGRGYGAWVQSSNWVKYVLDRRLSDPPGSRMEYSTGNSHLLSAILTRVSGASTWAFARDHLAKPLGINLQRWDRDPQDIYFGGNNMAMTPRQMLAFGELYRNRGRANGHQVIPESWIETSFVPRGRSHWSDELHGYGWWISELAGRRTYYAWGYGGQLIFILPDLDLVVVTTSSSSTGQTRRSHRRTVFDLVERHIVAPLHLSHARTANSATSAQP